MRKILLLITILLATQTFAFTSKQFLKNIRNNYDQLKAVDLEIGYQLYKGHTGTNLVEEYSSVYKRLNNQSYRKIGNTELINTTNQSLNINHENKQIILSKPSQTELLEVNIKETLKWCKDIKITEKNGEKSLHLILKSRTDIPYSSILVKVDKNFWIENLTFYYAVKMDFSSSYFAPDLAYPKMVVTYGKLKKKWKDKEKLLNTDRFIDQTAGELKLKEMYQNYQLIDLRPTN